MNRVYIYLFIFIYLYLYIYIYIYIYIMKSLRSIIFYYSNLDDDLVIMEIVARMRAIVVTCYVHRDILSVTEIFRYSNLDIQ